MAQGAGKYSLRKPGPSKVLQADGAEATRWEYENRGQTEAAGAAGARDEISQMDDTSGTCLPCSVTTTPEYSFSCSSSANAYV